MLVSLITEYLDLTAWKKDRTVNHTSVWPSSSEEKPAEGVQAPGWLPELSTARGDRPPLNRNNQHLQQEVPGWKPPHLSGLQPAAQASRYHGEKLSLVWQTPDAQEA